MLDKLRSDLVGRMGERVWLDGGWDSLQHLEVVMNVEMLYGVQFDTAEISGLNSLAAIAARLWPAQGWLCKLIVVDLDGTLWDGVLGEGTAEITMPYLAFQQALAELRSNGVLLAMASKNEFRDVMVALRNGEMVLDQESFSAMRVGWQPKPQYVRGMAIELGVGLDAVLFVDDSPQERELMRQQLPEVKVLELPADTYLWVQALRDCMRGGATTAEDRSRASMMAEQQGRQELRDACKTYDEFLMSLRQVATVEPLSLDNVERAAQLCQRTNQFNLTLMRHTADHLRIALGSRHAGVVLQVRDRYGDAGRVGFALALPDYVGGDWHLSVFVLSCRVISRRVEWLLLREICRAVADLGGRRLGCQYTAGPRNEPCCGFLEAAGFTPDPSPWHGVQPLLWLPVWPLPPAPACVQLGAGGCAVAGAQEKAPRPSGA